MGFFDNFGSKPKKPEAPRPPLQPVDVDVQLDAPGETLVSSIGDFGLQLAAQSPDENVVLSSYSVYEAWLRVWAGALGDCRDEIAEALALPDVNVQFELRYAHQALDRALGAECVLETANSIWKRPSLSLRDEFQAEWGELVQDTDFSDAEVAAETVNRWVSELTRGMVPTIVSPQQIGPLTAMILVNALYLDAKWDSTFEEDFTRDDEFEQLDGTKLTVPMMRDEAGYLAAATKDFELLRKPYAGAGLEMVFVLPRPGRFADVRDRLTWATVHEVMEASRGVTTDLKLPRFTIESSANVDELLKSRGARLVYRQDGADLGGMSDQARNPGEELFVGQTNHRAKIEVVEAGTRAAAATAVTFLAGCAPDFEPPPPPYPFHLNRPFLFCVVERSTGLPLFSGHVVQPEFQ